MKMPHDSPPYPQPTIRRRLNPTFVSLDSGETHLVTKPAFPQFLHTHSQVGVRKAAVVPNHKHILQAAENNVKTDSVHPGSVFQPCSSLGGHFYEKDSCLSLLSDFSLTDLCDITARVDKIATNRSFNPMVLLKNSLQASLPGESHLTNCLARHWKLKSVI